MWNLVLNHHKHTHLHTSPFSVLLNFSFERGFFWGGFNPAPTRHGYETDLEAGGNHSNAIVTGGTEARDTPTALGIIWHVRRAHTHMCAWFSVPTNCCLILTVVPLELYKQLLYLDGFRFQLHSRQKLLYLQGTKHFPLTNLKKVYFALWLLSVQLKQPLENLEGRSRYPCIMRHLSQTTWVFFYYSTYRDKSIKFPKFGCQTKHG